MGTWRRWFARPPAHMEALKRLYTMGSTGVPVEKRQMAEGENNLRPQLIQLNRSRNVLIEDCRFDQGDDAIAIKSGTNHDGWRLGRPSENIVIRNNRVVRGHQLVAIGSELSGGVRNVYVHDCRFDAATEPFNLLYVKTNRRRGGFVENVTMERVEATGTKFGVLGVETDVLHQWRTLVPAYEERLTGIRGITVRDVKVGRTATPFRILGDRDKPVRDILLDNITIGTVRGRKNRYENVENVKETNVRIGTFVEGPDQENRNR